MAMPRKGLQKYHDLKNSFTDFGFGVVVQFDSIIIKYLNSGAKIKNKIIKSQ
jgi:hypothetical protein